MLLLLCKGKLTMNTITKSFTKICNEEQILAIFNLGNETINDCLIKSCEHDKELEEIILKNADLKIHYLKRKL
jgi:hypothetical protein